MRLVEPIAVLDCYVDGLGRVEVLKGGNARFIMYVEHMTDDGEPVGVVVQKTVIHVEAVPEAISMTWAALGAALFHNVKDFLTHRVH